MRRRTLLAALPLAPLALAPLALAPLAPAPARAGDADAPVRLRDLYERDMSFSALALSLEGERIAVAGFMAPPLVADSRFFVLTKMPMAVCPFCEPTTTWPDDILAVYARRVVDVIRFTVPLVATGTLALGDFVDPELGFYSRVRLTDAAVARA